MKLVCPVCGIEGILESRGKSQRVLHYRGFIDGKRVYEKHSIMGVNGNKSLGIKTDESSLKMESGAFGGIWTRDHYLTKVTPHRARLRRHTCVVLRETMRLVNKMLTVFTSSNKDTNRFTTATKGLI